MRATKLEDLRVALVAFAAWRFDKTYDYETDTHVVAQREGTQFAKPGIRGTGAFADVAYADYLTNLRAFVDGLGDKFALCALISDGDMRETLARDDLHMYASGECV